MKHSPEENRQLLSRCFAGDRKAYEIFVRRFSDPVYRAVQYAFKVKFVSYGTSDLEDLHNTVFLGLFEDRCKKLRQYQGKNGCSLATWIRIVTVRTVLNHLRKKGMDSMGWQTKRIPLEDLPELKADGTEPWALMEKAEQERLLRDGIRNLPPRDRLFMKLHYNQGLPVEEVARAMELTMQNAYTVKHRAIQRLKSYVATAP